ncbi:MAG: response regulator [Synergistaceae bacterium]|jgi:signal transduction histidine kinase/CheY-like chemotaxis protein/HPt (histidine-containing phosphotransfer) domain-containing protein|nr:response regulator [Synergistaceae bacterium]
MDWRKVIRVNRKEIIFVFVAFFLMTLAGFISISDIMRRNLAEGLEDAMLAVDANIKSVLSDAEVTLINSTSAVGDIMDKGGSQEEIRLYLTNITELMRRKSFGSSNFFGIYGFIRREFIDSIGLNPGADYIPQRRPWYDAAIRIIGDAVAYTAPYVDAKTGQLVISVVRHIREKSPECFDVLALDVDLSWFSEYIRSLRLVRGGYGFIVDQNMVLVGHPKREFVGAQLQNLGDSYASLPDMFLDGRDVTSLRMPDYDGTASIASFMRMSNGWYMGVVIPLHNYYSYVYATTITLAALGIFLALCLSYILLRLSAAKMRSDEESRGKSSFLARMSHEIRTPMNAVMGLSELALRTDSLSLIAEYLAGIKQAGNNLLSIINDILDFSKIESGNLEITPSPYILASMLNDVVNVIRVRISEKPILFTVNVLSKIPNNLIGDETRIRQVLLNLLSNAVKYTNEGYIMFNVTGERTSPESILLKFEICDSGAGIKPEDLKKLFGEFIRLDMEHNRGVEGTGLGLAITRKLCLAMNGNVEAKSVYGEGSVFSASIPQNIENDVPLAVVEDRDGKRILFYDERTLYAESACLTLEDLGINVTVTTEPEEFFERLASRDFQFAFVNPEVAERARDFIRENDLKTALVLLAGLGELSSFQDIPAIIMPAYAVSIANALNYQSTQSEGRENQGVRFVAPNARVLLVDDILTNLVVARGLLAPYMMRVDSCENGEESVALSRTNGYDLVLMDHMMPGMDGIDATKAIRAMGDGFKELPIVALTANAVSGMRETFIKSGMNDFLSKPIDPTKLDAILRKWIPREKQLLSESAAPKPTPAPGVSFKIGGVDTVKGIAMTGGTEANYRGVLEIFCRDADDRMDYLNFSCAENDIKNFTTQVHALKSASASIGAAEISRVAEAMENAGRGGDMELIRGCVDDFRRNLSGLVSRVRAELSSAEVPPNDREPAKVSPDGEIIPRLTRLRDALLSEDVGAIDALLAELCGLALDKATSAALSNISDLVLTAEFGEAITVIADMIEARDRRRRSAWEKISLSDL